MAFVTVIVPVRNESRAIENTLRSVLTQDYPADQFEVIVADGASTDDTVPVIRRLQAEYPNLKLVYNPARFSSAGRNTAIRHMTGEVAVIIDGHCQVPDPNYLSNLTTAFAESQADCLGRPQPLETVSPSPFQQAVSIARSSRLGHNPNSDIYSDQPKFVHPGSTAVAYRRSVFQKIGLFDQAFDACEDVEFNERVHRAGLSCYFTPTLRIGYHPRADFRGLFYQLARYGCGRARLSWKHPGSLTPAALVPPFWLIWLVVGFPLACVVPMLGWLYGGSVLLYMSVLLAAAVQMTRNRPWSVRLRIPAVFVGIHFGFAWGFLKETVRQLRTRIGHNR